MQLLSVENEQKIYLNNQSSSEIDKDKKRKNDDIFVKNIVEKCKKPPKLSNIKRNKYNQLIKETKLDIYARVLLDAFRTIPNVIKILDSLITSRATTISPLGPTGFSYNAFDDVDKILSLTERKEKLINLYIIAKKMIKSLSLEDQKFLVKKFIQKRNSDDLALELGINKRNIFRKSNSIITKLCYFLLSQNWTSDFLEIQIGEDEPWLKDLFKRRADEYRANIKRSLSASKN